MQADLPYIPEYITVHLGAPSAQAENVTIPFQQYIENVASSEIRNGAEQSNQTMSGVCGHWVRSFQASHRPCPASEAGFRRAQRC